MHKDKTARMWAAGALAFVVLGACSSAQAQQSSMTFFVTSAGPGKGGDLGGLSGADAHCQSLAQSVGAGSRTWRAYLSISAAGGAAAVNARDRIGRGPWQNVKGEVVAKDVADLHGASNNLTKQTALTEKGEIVNGRGDTPNTHDVLTGSQPDGTAFAGTDDKTCGNWTKRRRRFRCRRTSRPHGPGRQRPGQVVELLARLAWVQRGCAEDHRRSWLAVLLRDQRSVPISKFACAGRWVRERTSKS